MPPGAAAHELLKDQGLVRLDGVLSAESASALRTAELQRLTSVLSDQRGKEEDRTKLRGVMCSSLRHNLLLRPEGGIVEAALREALHGPLGELMEAAVGSEAPLFDLAMMVSEKGAQRQPMHSDTPYQAQAPLYTAFVALQDISVEMGPTLFMPGTHTETAQDQFIGSEIDRQEVLQQAPLVVSTLRKGDVAVFDSRLLHAAEANTEGTRALFWFSFGNPAADLRDLDSEPWDEAAAAGRDEGAGSIDPRARGRYHLADFRPKV
eukprot:gnl/TRDRNA2_/TRDRNA2_88996_c0_seq1.p1 gnl/TRDRNA2_/TRDRNA2_88996_c0~~gnl/TRDRNA2_/TRDRNA2_88996_c0_seq1.p1  ORF type:complete len:264 (-),score=49.36 gnl/TRDRNA2_/TRDRNA2_88996_c0_seq1:265-1056(-)